MQPLYKRFSVISGFVLLLIVLIINGVVLRRQLAVQTENERWVGHTRQVLFELAATESLLKDAETGQRGYLYTGDSKYLGPYQQSIQHVDEHVQMLADLTSDNPRQQVRIKQLQALCRQKLAELSETIVLYQSGNPAGARALVVSDVGRVTMDRIRDLITEMQQEESGLEEGRTRAYAHSVRMTVVCVYLASTLAAIGLILLAYYIVREMNLREKYGLAIKQREEWFRVTLTSIGDGVIATDEHGVVTFVNPVAEKLTGRSLGQSRERYVSEVFPIFNEVTLQPVENPVKKVIELGRVVGLANHTVLQHSDGTLTPIEDSAAPIRSDSGELVGVVLVFRDATVERRSQEVLRKTEKLAAAARLAATVAHEINNPLEAVGNLIYLAKARKGVPHEVVEDLKLAEQELDRVSHITRQTLGFYRESAAPQALDVPLLVDSVMKIYANKLKSKGIRIEHDIGDCPAILGWPGELKQLISNLVSNAADAVNMEGMVSVRVSPLVLKDGTAVQLHVEDDGPGIAPEYMGRIFEPFFTTKKNVGTGLGLWVVKEIVERHGGTIQVQSRFDGNGGGTAFTVVLPCAAAEKSQAAPAG